MINPDISSVNCKCNFYNLSWSFLLIIFFYCVLSITFIFKWRNDKIKRGLNKTILPYNMKTSVLDILSTRNTDSQNVKLNCRKRTIPCLSNTDCEVACDYDLYYESARCYQHSCVYELKSFESNGTVAQPARNVTVSEKHLPFYDGARSKWIIYCRDYRVFDPLSYCIDFNENECKNGTFTYDGNLITCECDPNYVFFQGINSEQYCVDKNVAKVFKRSGIANKLLQTIHLIKLN